MRFRLVASLGVVAFTTVAAAQPPAPAAKFAVPGSRDSASTGGKDARPRVRYAAFRTDAAVATFPGFRLLPDGRSRIYVELTKQVSVDERRAEGMLVYVIHGARVPVKNNRNALLTTHFATPVARARLLTAGSDVELIIDLRKAASASQKIVPSDNGGVRLEVDFAAGDYPPAPGMFEPPAAKRGGDKGESEGVYTGATQSPAANVGAPSSGTNATGTAAQPAQGAAPSPAQSQGGASATPPPAGPAAPPQSAPSAPPPSSH